MTFEQSVIIMYFAGCAFLACVHLAFNYAVGLEPEEKVLENLLKDILYIVACGIVAVLSIITVMNRMGG